MRIRSIKPDWLDDQISLASSDARVLSIGLVLLADDHGRGRIEPDLMKSRVFPGGSHETFMKALEGISRLRFALLYECEGQKYYAIRTWKKHQYVQHPTDSRLPAPGEKRARIYRTLDEFTATHEGLMRAHESIRKLPDSRDPNPIPLPGLSDLFQPDPDQPDRSSHARAKGRPARWRRAPGDFAPGDKHRKLAASLGVDFELELAKFRDHEFDKPKSDADRSFSNWLRNAKKFGGAQQPQQRINGLAQRAMELEAEERRQ